MVELAASPPGTFPLCPMLLVASALQRLPRQCCHQAAASRSWNLCIRRKPRPQILLPLLLGVLTPVHCLHCLQHHRRRHAKTTRPIHGGGELLSRHLHPTIFPQWATIPCELIRVWVLRLNHVRNTIRRPLICLQQLPQCTALMIALWGNFRLRV